MTGPAGSDVPELDVGYEGRGLTFGGSVTADFILRQPHQRALECNLGLAVDAQALFRETLAARGGGPLDEDGLQAILRVLAATFYRRLVAEGREIPAVALRRRVDVDPADVAAILSEAGLSETVAGGG